MDNSAPAPRACPEPAVPPDRLTEIRLLLPFLDDGLPGAAALCDAALDHFGSLANLVHACPSRVRAWQSRNPRMASFARRLADARALHAALLRAPLADEPVHRNEILSNPDAIRRYLLARPIAEGIETFTVLLFDTHLRLIADVDASRGTLDRTVVHPREIARLALDHHAASLVAAHNHVSGSHRASEADWKLTRNLRETLHVVDVDLNDHFVLAGGVATSLREERADVFAPRPGVPNRYTADLD